MENVGGIQYTVEANTGQLLKAEQDTVRSVDKIDRTLKGLGGSSKHVNTVSKSIKELGEEADRSGFKLSKIQTALVGLATVTTASSIAKMADDYRAMSERVLGASESLEEFNLVQARLLESANKTFRPLAEAQELFVAVSGNLRESRYSLDDSLKIMDSMSYGFVRNAASSDKAATAIRNYDAALSTGKVNQNQWLAISSAIDTLTIDMGKSMGITAKEVDDLGYRGLLTAKDLNDGLLASFQANKDGADAMANTIEDAVTAMKNNISVYIGELNKSVGATDIVAKSIIYLSENIETLAKVLAVAGSGALAKYVTQVGLVTVAKMKSALATRSQLAEESRLLKANVQAAQAEVARTASILAQSEAHSKSARNIQAHTIAVANLDRAQKAASISASGFLSILGGPAGLIGLLTIGVTSLVAFSSAASDAKVNITELHKPIEELTDKIKEMGKAQRDAFLVKYKDEQQQAIRDMSAAYDDLESIMRNSLEKQRGVNFELNKSWADLSNEISQRVAEAKKDGSDLSSFLTRISEQYNIPQDVVDSWVRQNRVVSEASTLVANATKNYELLQGAAREATKAITEAGEAARKQAEINAGATKDIDSFTKSLQSQFNTMQDGGSKVKELNRFYEEQAAKGVILTEEQEKQKEANYALAQSIDNERESRKNANKEIKTSNNVLKDLQNELYLATLSGKELAIARAEQRLNEFATQQEVQAVRDLAAALYDLQTIGGTKEKQDEYIDGDTGRLTGGAFDDQIARYEEEAELERQRYADQLERLMQARETQLQTEEEYNQKEFELREKHNERMGRIEQAKNEVRLKSYASAAQSIAAVLSKSNDEQSGFYKAAFAVAKGFAIADATVNAWNAISKAWASAPFPANLGAVAATTPAVMGVVSAIQGTSYGGGRQYGGYVSPDKYYRINETGMPEIYNDRSGNQYMLPTSGGSITPANKIDNQSGGANVTINLIENPDRGGEILQSEDDRGSIVDIFVADINSGGEMASTLESTYSLVRRGN